MKHKNSYYDTATILGYPDMKAVRAAGVKNPTAEARKIIALGQNRNQKARKADFYSNMSETVKEVIRGFREQRKLIEDQRRKRKKYSFA